jgi:hypothetical protein
MVHKLMVELSDEVYAPLIGAAQRAGTPPEELAAEWLAAACRYAASDPVEGFIGALRGDVPDWAGRHDEYLGRELAERPDTGS